jgi:cyclic beta-1,2-glucan synthetase
MTPRRRPSDRSAKDPLAVTKRQLRPTDEFAEPILDELFSVERLEQHARTLAAAQQVTETPFRGRDVRSRVDENGRVLVESYRELARAIRDERAVTPAAEWLVDNFPIVDEQLREIRDDLPPDYYRELPKLAEGHLMGYPRVLGLTWAYIAHTDSRIDPESLRRTVRAYQEVEPLTIGELWAIAISLRILLVENLRRLTEQMVRRRAARQVADELADQVMGPDPGGLSERQLERVQLPIAGRVQLFQRLRDLDPATTPALRWLEQHLVAQDTTAEEMVRLEHQRQAAMNVTVRNVITSMRLLSWFDWATFVEDVSLVDHVLRSESEFSSMDFATRNRYRNAIEDLARRSGRSEIEVARLVTGMARAGPLTPDLTPTQQARRRDPGYFLISGGRLSLEQALGVRVRPLGHLRRSFVRAAGVGYLATIAAITVGILVLPTVIARHLGATTLSTLVMVLLVAIPVSDLAIALANRGFARVLGPRPLPRLDLGGGIPAPMRTLVVVPMLLVDQAEIEEQVRGLEVHFLGNRDGDVRFALLSDWADAPTEHVEGDDELLATAAAGIDSLNEQHGEAPSGGARFLLFHRARTWNERDGCWMGWERKRGKLHELNELLRGSTTTGILTSGRASSTPPNDVRYVITLDADTRLPLGAVSQLVATIAHPLNRPSFDASCRRVTEGYGILQPRITPTLPAEHSGSLYQRIFSGPAGVDPYASAVSDIYQDLFQEGSYTGKGIYDVDAFRAALADRVPENAMLSHDLFEGAFARAGLATDIELFDEFPANYLVAARRLHRWARGDWQLLPWIVGRARDEQGARQRRALPRVARGKMLDNLRRTLSAPAVLAAFVVAWTTSSESALLWTAFLLSVLVIPAALPVVAGLRPRRPGTSKRSHWLAVGSDVLVAIGHVLFSIVFLAHQAWLMVDAVIRTMIRLTVTRRRLLEWTTAARVKADHRVGVGRIYRAMFGSVVLAIGIGVVAMVLEPGNAWVVVPFVAVWSLAPLIALLISLPPAESAIEELSPAEIETLRLTARRTWLFFETFVGPDDHGLPPDNYQDDPIPAVAHRTSPTNIGMYLLATVTARDFGWIGTLEMVDRLEATMETIDRLDRFRGHLFNWYDTRDLRTLEPRYVSSVDSGNLAGHLLTLSSACRRMIDEPLPIPEAIAGIDDGVTLTREAARALGGGRSQTLTTRHVDEALAPLVANAPLPSGPQDWAARLAQLDDRARTLSDVTAALTAERGDGADGELVVWSAAVARAIGSHRQDLALLLAGDPSDAFRSIAELAEPVVAADGTVREGSPEAAALVRRLTTVALRAQELFLEMDFGFLFDPTRKLFSIGFRERDGSLDPSYYDLLASEARLTSFLAIAKGDVEPDHWFRLGRSLTPVGRGSALVSWSGSMFEYLMPALVMRSPARSLLDHTNRLVVARQIRYAAELGIPWGISESGFNARDLQQNYQYSGFGVPGLGLKRGLSEDIVVAPYATALAAMIEPKAAIKNFARLRAAGGAGRYGFREALDYTERRRAEGQPVAIVNSYMAHHQGMTLVAIGNVLHGRTMVDRFHADPIVAAAELLLHERLPRDVLVSRPRAEEVKSAADVRDLVPPILRRFTSPHDAIPRTHVLSNGRYAVMMTTAGSGYSRWRDLAVTRWREDVTCDSWGSFLYLRDMDSGVVWSAGHQPCGVEADSYEVTYSEDRAEFSRRDGSIVTSLTVVVSAEHDAEIRRVSLTNLGARERHVELTSYAEIVLATQAADVAHPAFQNLFIQTEFMSDIGALLATRRARSDDEVPIWAAHVAAVEDQAVGVVQYETDRARFIGRGRTPRSPVSVVDGHPLSNTVGSVLDPIFSLRCRVTLAPGETVHTIFSTVVAESRDEVIDLADKYRESATFERAAILAWTQAQVQLHHLGIEPDEAHLFQRLGNRVLYSDPSLRPAERLLAMNERGAPGLWVHGISGDLPIVLVRIDEADDLDHRPPVAPCSRVLAAEAPRRRPRDPQRARRDLRPAPPRRASTRSCGPASSLLGTTAGRVVGGSTSSVATNCRPSIARCCRAWRGPCCLSRRGTLADQVVRLELPERTDRPAATVRSRRSNGEPSTLLPELEFFNGLGGFAKDGREYVTVLGPGQSTPAPWLNVIANPSFGFQVSESGAGYTWSGNSRENQLTPWSNDPVSDPCGEAIYIRDDETGELWGPTALPIRCEDSTYVARHGAGYSRFEHVHNGIRLDLTQFVPLADAVKISVLTVENRSGRARRLSVTAFAEWTLGTSRGADGPRIVTLHEAETGAVLARNPWNIDFGGRVAFLDLSGRQTGWTADRTEFLGRNGAADRPAGLDRGRRLGGADGAGLDPCAALQTGIELADGARTRGGRPARRGRRHRRGRRPRSAALAGPTTPRCSASVMTFWDDTQRNDPGEDPGPLDGHPAQRLAHLPDARLRMWARSAFYQAGGAYGFRDQLQDVIALMTARSAASRASILLLAAARQFPRVTCSTGGTRRRVAVCGPGSPTTSSGCRTWSIGTSRSPATRTVLDEQSCRSSRGCNSCPSQMDAYFQPERSNESARSTDIAPRRSTGASRSAQHGLPLMGSGDWNDGMNRVGHGGRGESVWLGWFLSPRSARSCRSPRRVATRPRDVVDHAHGGAARGARAPWLGRRLVPACLLRRRHSARLGRERRMPDRLDRPVVERAVRRCRSGPLRAGDGGGG